MLHWLQAEPSFLGTRKATIRRSTCFLIASLSLSNTSSPSNILYHHLKHNSSSTHSITRERAGISSRRLCPIASACKPRLETSSPHRRLPPSSAHPTSDADDSPRYTSYKPFTIHHGRAERFDRAGHSRHPHHHQDLRQRLAQEAETPASGSWRRSSTPQGEQLRARDPSSSAGCPPRCLNITTLPSFAFVADT